MSAARPRASVRRSDIHKPLPLVPPIPEDGPAPESIDRTSYYQPNGENESSDGGSINEDKRELQQHITLLNNNVASLERQVSLLARQLALRSINPSIRSRRTIEKEEAPENTFLATLDENSNLNPHGPNFDYTAWIKNLLAVASTDGEKPKQRKMGVAFRNLGVYGIGSPTSYQKDVYSALLSLSSVARRLAGTGTSRIQILHGFDGMVKNGEMLLVLGRPGSGCSTFLKTIAGEMDGIYTNSESYLNYQGISPERLRTQFRGEAIYTAENDVHFPQLTVSQTLSFAARARVPRNRMADVTRDQYAEHMKDVVMAIFGLTNCANTNVGNEFIRGVSGGERKRVSIAEATLNGSPLQCWDNSTRGLDAANAVEFCKNLRIQSDLFSRTACVAIYQGPEAAYELFHKVTVLYEGRQIYFGRAKDAKKFFTDMGFLCPERQTTPDFLTSLTNPEERIVREGFENYVPRTPDEFVAVWKSSRAYKHLMGRIDAFDQHFPAGGLAVEKFGAMRKAEQSKRQRATSPYTISIPMQISLCIGRGFARLRADTSLFISALIGNTVLALIVGSVFYNLQPTTASLFSRSALLFFATLLNAFASALEILTIYAQRPIVEKHSRYALYHPFSEAAASIICDIPSKVSNALLFNTALYFLTNLRRTPEAFTTFFLFSFVTTMTMSMIFRTIGAVSKTLAQAMAPSALLTLGLCIYTGFPIPVTDMLGWSRWMNYVNPLGYTFESLMVNELSGRDFECSQYIPSGPGYISPGPNSICATVGAVTGKATVAGDDYLIKTYQYFPSHLWRNLAIIAAFMAFFCFTYLWATEFITEAKSKGEVLLFRRKDKPQEDYRDFDEKFRGTPLPNDLARRPPMSHGRRANIQKHRSIIHWRNVCYDISIGKEQKRILDHVDGWVKPGTCTALMGASGAGKTTLLDVLASRVRVGVVSGEILVDGIQRDSSFQRKTGYVQQADLHLSTSTVREAMRFSAVLRQPPHIPVKDRIAYVDEVIKLLDMEPYADAVVGVPGEGLNIEQRKRLTIAIELVAKPQLLILLDEPTSGLDSQTAWSIMNLLETLKRHGQAVLCTIHQPSAPIFQRFDRLLLLSKGRTIYFGEIGENASKMIRYFEQNGSSPCPAQANPAEWMLEVIGTAPGSKSEIDWTTVWRRSPEYQQVHMHLGELAMSRGQSISSRYSNQHADYNEFAASFPTQLRECGYRIFSQYWRTPSYIYSKFALSALSSLYIGFTFFNATNTEQGVQNQIFSIFMLMTVFGNLVTQILPNFVAQRDLFEARERPAKIYSWQAFMLVNIFVELCWNTLAAVFMYFCWYYPIGYYRNAIPTNAVLERGGLMFLLIWSFLLFTSTFAHLIIAGIEVADAAGYIASVLYSLCLIFCGVLASPTALPGFWIFMYRVSPFTYLVSSMASTAVGNTDLICSDVELLNIVPPTGASCEEYLGPFLQFSGGYLQNTTAVSNCQVCPISKTDALLSLFGIQYQDRWRNLPLMFAYIVFNAIAALGIYWLARVPRGNMQKAEPGQNNVQSAKGSPRTPNMPPPPYGATLSRTVSLTSSINTETTNFGGAGLIPSRPSRARTLDRSRPRTPAESMSAISPGIPPSNLPPSLMVPARPHTGRRSPFPLSRPLSWQHSNLSPVSPLSPGENSTSWGRTLQPLINPTDNYDYSHRRNNSIRRENSYRRGAKVAQPIFGL